MARTLAIIIVALGIPLLLTMTFAAPHYKTLAAVALLSAISYVLVLWFLEFRPAEAKMLERAILPKTRSASGQRLSSWEK
jgi:hypothetical protein